MDIKLITTAAVSMFAAGFALILQKGDWNRVNDMMSTAAVSMLAVRFAMILQKGDWNRVNDIFISSGAAKSLCGASF